MGDGDRGLVPAWIRTTTFVAWLVSMFAPAGIVAADARPYISGFLMLVFGSSVGKDVVDKLKGDKAA
jgi:hypothetical protein